jgi:hypothetical protein
MDAVKHTDIPLIPHIPPKIQFVKKVDLQRRNSGNIIPANLQHVVWNSIHVVWNPRKRHHSYHLYHLYHILPKTFKKKAYLKPA